MKFAYLIPITALAVVAGPALAQSLQQPGASGNPGAIIHAVAYRSASYNGHATSAGMNRYYAKEQMLENGRVMLRDIKKQLAAAKTDEERQALLERKHQIEDAMIEAQQKY